MTRQDGSCQNYEIASRFVKVIQRKLLASLFRTRCIVNKDEYRSIINEHLEK